MEIGEYFYACVDLGTQGSTRGLQQFLFYMPSMDTRQVMGDRLDGEPGTRGRVTDVRDVSAHTSNGLGGNTTNRSSSVDEALYQDLAIMGDLMSQSYGGEKRRSYDQVNW